MSAPAQDEVAGLRAEVERLTRERDEARSAQEVAVARNKTLIAEINTVLGLRNDALAEKGRAEEQAAAMRAALDAIYNHNAAARAAVIQHYGALHPTDAGKGWIPPEQAAAMREALESTWVDAEGRTLEPNQCARCLEVHPNHAVGCALHADAGRELLERVERYERALKFIAKPDSDNLSMAVKVARAAVEGEGDG